MLKTLFCEVLAEVEPFSRVAAAFCVGLAAGVEAEELFFFALVEAFDFDLDGGSSTHCFFQGFSASSVALILLAAVVRMAAPPTPSPRTHPL